MQMIRTFHAVGQGAFYTERFEGGRNIVYDCGTSSRFQHFEREMDREFNKDETIDAVFISHLHADHCNGLERLLRECNVRKLFLPFLNEEDKIFALLAESLAGGVTGFTWELINNPMQTLRRMNAETEIVSVYPTDREEYDTNQEEWVSDIGRVTGNIRSGMELSVASGRSKWIYVPFYFRQTQHIKEMKDALTAAGLDFPKTGEEVKALWESDKALLRSIYNKITGGTKNYNASSMVVYSGPSVLYEESDTWAHEWNPDAEGCLPECIVKQLLDVTCCRDNEFCGFCTKEFPAGCLYTGDYNAKDKAAWDALEKFVEPYRSQIGSCQLPHHGSKHNYNPHLKELCGEYVVSCQKGRRSHPGGNVIKDLLLDGKKVSLVTEEIGSRKYYIIDGWDR